MTPRTLNDPEYLRRRRAQHRDLAARAENAKARDVHAELADRFAALLDQRD